LSTTLQLPKQMAGATASVKCLRKLEVLRRRAPRERFFTLTTLDMIVGCGNRKEDRLSVWDGAYLEAVATRLKWWLAICELIAEENPRPLAADIEHLIDDAVTQWAAVTLARRPRSLAKIATNTLAMYQVTNADLELLRRYRRMTRSLANSARRVWPSASHRWIEAKA